LLPGFGRGEDAKREYQQLAGMMTGQMHATYDTFRDRPEERLANADYAEYGRFRWYQTFEAGDSCPPPASPEAA
jgi:hypothetical protein